MSDSYTPETTLAEARDDGRRQGLAIAAVGVALAAFLNLLGLEKDILAVVLAVAALSGSRTYKVRRRSFIALGLVLLHLALSTVLLLLYREELGQLVQLLYKLG